VILLLNQRFTIEYYQIIWYIFQLQQNIDDELDKTRLEFQTLERKLNARTTDIYHQMQCNGLAQTNSLLELSILSSVKDNLEREKRANRCIQNIKYPFAMLILLILTVSIFITLMCVTCLQGISVLMVGINTLQLLFGYRSLPTYAQYIELGSRHTLGLFGAIVEIVIILYVCLYRII